MTNASHLTKPVIQQLMGLQGLNPGLLEDREKFLCQWPKKARAFSHAPFSGFIVGAAAFLNNGEILLGANFEYGNDLVNTIHAEQAIVIQALALNLKIEAMAITGIPCGFCRQTLYEIAGSAGIKMFLADGHVCTLKDLFPKGFGPADLGQTQFPPEHAKHKTIKEGAWEKIPASLRDTLVAALEQSYAPWTHSEAAVVVLTRFGDVVQGSYWENAAFNPSVSAIRAAIVQLAHSGRGPVRGEDIDQVWVAYNKESRLDHLSQTNYALSGLGAAAKVQSIAVTLK